MPRQREGVGSKNDRRLARLAPKSVLLHKIQRANGSAGQTGQVLELSGEGRGSIARCGALEVRSDARKRRGGIKRCVMEACRYEPMRARGAFGLRHARKRHIGVKPCATETLAQRPECLYLSSAAAPNAFIRPARPQRAASAVPLRPQPPRIAPPGCGSRPAGPSSAPPRAASTGANPPRVAPTRRARTRSPPTHTALRKEVRRRSSFRPRCRRSEWRYCCRHLAKLEFCTELPRRPCDKVLATHLCEDWMELRALNE